MGQPDLPVEREELHEVMHVHVALLEALPGREVEVARHLVHLQLPVDIAPLPLLLRHLLHVPARRYDAASVQRRYDTASVQRRYSTEDSCRDTTGQTRRARALFDCTRPPVCSIQCVGGFQGSTPRKWVRAARAGRARAPLPLALLQDVHVGERPAPLPVPLPHLVAGVAALPGELLFDSQTAAAQTAAAPAVSPESSLVPSQASFLPSDESFQ